VSTHTPAAPEALVHGRRKLVDAVAITARHDALLENPRWPGEISVAGNGTIDHWIDFNHHCNTQLWAQEDLARRTHVADAEIVANKRAIDRYNQQRNDAVEKLDELLLASLGWWRSDAEEGCNRSVCLPQGARLHSETAGSMVDRLSILALKIHAVGLLIRNALTSADASHSLSLKLHRLCEQRADLAFCLDTLWSDAVAGRAGFKIYRQFKLYNDSRTNPALIAESQRQQDFAGAACGPSKQGSGQYLRR